MRDEHGRGLSFGRWRGLAGLLVSLVALGGCGDGVAGRAPRGAPPFVLRVVSQPVGFIAGEPSVVGLEVALEDPFGGRLVNASGSVEVSVEPAGVAAILSGVTVVTPGAGLARFAGLAFDRPAVGLRLRVRSAGFDDVTTGSFDVFAAGSVRLGFAVEPSKVVAGDAITPAVEVAVQDALGGTVGAATTLVTLGLDQGPSAASLSGTLTVAAVAGVARFTDLRLDKAGSGQRLIASAASLQSATSAAFEVSAGALQALRFAAPPSGVVATAGIEPAVAVRLEDRFGNLVLGASDPVSLELAQNPAGARLAGRGEVKAVAGVARFTELRLDRAGAGFTLLASSAVVQSSVESAAFSVADEAPSVSALAVPTGRLSGCVAVSYVVTQAGGLGVDLELSFDAEGNGVFQRATQAGARGAGSQGVQGAPSASAPAGRAGVFLWNSSRDLGGRNIANLTLRMTARFGSGTSAAAELTGLAVENRLAYEPVLTTSVGAGPRGLVTVDLDGDGRLDLVAASTSAQRVSFSLQDPAQANGFAAALELVAGVDPVDVAAADLDGDGRLDLVCANAGDETLSVFLRDAVHGVSFAPAVQLQAESLPQRVAIADLDGDGRLDLVCANAGAGLSIHLQDPAQRGAFLSAIDVPAGAAPSAVGVADLNGDGRLDLAVASRGDDAVTVLLQSAGAPFAFAIDASYPCVAEPTSVVAGPLFSERGLSLVVGGAGAAELSLLRPDPQSLGRFMPAVSASLSAPVTGLAQADLNGDGRRELVASLGADGRVAVLGREVGAASGYAIALELPVGAGPASLSVADLDGDGRLDIACSVTGDDAVARLSGGLGARCDPGFQAARLTPLGFAASRLAAGDLDGDGRSDLASLDTAGGALRVDFGAGHGGFEARSVQALFGAPVAVAFGELSVAAGLELAVVSSASETVTTLRFDRSGAGQLIAIETLPTAAGPSAVAVGFIDVDGRPDIAVAHRLDDSVFLYRRAASDERFEAPLRLVTGASPVALVIADFDGDLQGEVAVANVGSDSVTLLRAEPDQPDVFVATELQTAAEPSQLEARDLDGDGQLELTVLCRSGERVLVFVRDGAPGLGFSPPIELETGAAPEGFGFVDLDADGRLDLVIADDSGLSARLQGPGLSFGASVSIAAASAGPLLTLDLDGDGQRELVLAEPALSALLSVDVDGAGGLVGQESLATALATAVSLAVDLDGEGRVDLVQGELGGLATLRLHAPVDAAQFGSSSTLAVGDPSDLVVADLDADGALDLIFSSSLAGRVTLFFQDPVSPGSFPRSLTLTTPSRAGALLVAELDGDGRPDIVVAEPDRASLRLFLQSSALRGDFGPSVSLGVGAGPAAVISGDLDGDGRPDLVVACEGDGRLDVLRQDAGGAGVFSTLESVALSSSTASPVGLLRLPRSGELAVVCAGARQVELLRLDPSVVGGLTRAAQLDLDVVPTAVHALQLDGQGRDELLVVSSTQLTLVDVDPSLSMLILDRFVSPAAAGSASLADLDGDGLLDLVLGSAAAPDLGLLFGR